MFEPSSSLCRIHASVPTLKQASSNDLQHGLPKATFPRGRLFLYLTVAQFWGFKNSHDRNLTIEMDAFGEKKRTQKNIKTGFVRRSAAQEKIGHKHSFVPRHSGAEPLPGRQNRGLGLGGAVANSCVISGKFQIRSPKPPALRAAGYAPKFDLCNWQCILNTVRTEFENRI